MEALAIPIASFILGAFGLFITIQGRMNGDERTELRNLRDENGQLRTTIRELRDENIYLQRRAVGLDTSTNG